MYFLLSFFPFISHWFLFYIMEVFTNQNINKYNKLNKINYNIVFNTSFITTFINGFINLSLLYFNILDTTIFRYTYIIYGMIMIDTIEYFMHRALHKYKFLYKFHKTHHDLLYPYHIAGFYNSLVENIIEYTLLLSGFYIFNFSFNEYIIILILVTIFSALDHSNLNFKKNVHYLHHNKYPNYNFQQPFFTYYDRLFGTYKVD